jgi:plasmid stabilization system protein ParE
VTGYALHPEAFNDIDEIRAYIADDNPDAADRMVTEVFDSIRTLVLFPHQGY